MDIQHVHYAVSIQRPDTRITVIHVRAAYILTIEQRADESDEPCCASGPQSFRDSWPHTTADDPVTRHTSRGRGAGCTLISESLSHCAVASSQAREPRGLRDMTAPRVSETPPRQRGWRSSRSLSSPDSACLFCDARLLSSRLPRLKALPPANARALFGLTPCSLEVASKKPAARSLPAGAKTIFKMRRSPRLSSLTRCRAPDSPARTSSAEFGGVQCE